MENTNPAENQPKKRSLGISKEVRGKSGIPISAPYKLDKRTPQFPNQYEFPIARLVKVHFDPAKEVKRQTGTENLPIVSFTFVTAQNKQFTHVCFPIDEDEDEVFANKLGDLHQVIKHIFEEAVGIDKFDEADFTGETFTELFSNTAKAFQKYTITKGEGENAKVHTIAELTPLYIKLTYYKTTLQFPKYPNFVQRAKNGTIDIPCELLINPKYDKLEPSDVAKPNAGVPAYGAQDNGFGDNAGFAAFPTLD
jgi:hypothetical protein